MVLIWIRSLNSCFLKKCLDSLNLQFAALELWWEGPHWITPVATWSGAHQKWVLWDKHTLCPWSTLSPEAAILMADGCFSRGSIPGPIALVVQTALDLEWKIGGRYIFPSLCQLDVPFWMGLAREAWDCYGAGPNGPSDHNLCLLWPWNKEELWITVGHLFHEAGTKKLLLV